MEGVGRPVRTDLASVWVVVNEFVKRRGNRGTMRDRAITVPLDRGRRGGPSSPFEGRRRGFADDLGREGVHDAGTRG